MVVGQLVGSGRVVQTGSVLTVPASVEEHGLALDTLTAVRIVRLAELMARTARRTFEPRFGLRNTDLRILNVLSARDAVPVSELARVTQVGKGWISRSLGELETKRLVRRFAVARDRRVLMVGLTDEGAQLLAAVTPVALERERQLLAGLDEHKVAAMLDRLLANAEAME